MVIVFRLILLVALLVPRVADAGSSAQMESFQREAVQQATPQDDPVKGASPMFANFGVGRVGHAAWSLLIPGWSQYRAGHNGRAMLFAGLEAAIWTVYGVSEAQANQRENSYQDFARGFAGVSGDRSDDDYWSAVGKYKNSDDYNERVRRDNRAEAEEQELNGGPVTVGLNDGTVGGPDTWFWTSGNRLLEYRELRADAQTAYDRADAMLFFAIVNRLVAFVEAIRSGPGEEPDNEVQLYEVGGFEFSARLDPNPLRPSGALLFGRDF